jgi:DNA-binding NarL/FixJ family response regulator
MVWRMPPEHARITVLLVEDHLLVAEGLAAMLHATGDLEVVGTAATAAEAVRLAAVHHPDVVVMDSHLPDGAGSDVAGHIREHHPHAALVFLSADESEVAMIAAVRAGACAYLPKSRATADVVDAVRRAAEGEMLIPAAQLARLLARSHEMARDDHERQRLLEAITPRENEVLSLMAEGLDNRAIAAELGIGFSTVRGHVQNILEKLDAHSKLEALACAARYGLLDAA